MSKEKFIYLLFSIAIFLLLFLYFFHPVTNLVGDLAFYLKTGEIIFKTGIIPSTNLFSYTYPNFPFINPNWLSELLFSICYHLFGFVGLTSLAILLALSSFSIIFLYSYKKFGPFSTLLVALVSVQILYERTDIKPELFSFLFLSLFITILYRYREKYTRWIFLLPVLELLWVNMHIYFFIGIVILLLFLVEELFFGRKNLQSKKFLSLFITFGATILVTIFNPHFLSGALYPFAVLHNYAFPVEENIGFFTALGYDTHDPTLLFFGLAVAMLWTGIILLFHKFSFIDIILALFFTFLGFFAIRTSPLFVFGTFIPLVKLVSFTVEIILKRASEKKKILVQFVTLSCVVVLMIPSIIMFIKLQKTGFGVIDHAAPAIQFLQQNNIAGPFYNNYDIGEYLAFRLYPQEKVFVDNRPEAYPKEFFENTYFPMQQSMDKFSHVSNQYHFNALIIQHTDTSEGTTKLLQMVVKSKDWSMVYLNNSVVIFLRNDPQNQSVIRRYDITEQTEKINLTDITDIVTARQMVNFFRVIGWNHSWLQANLEYLRFDPTNCAALENVAYIYQQENSSEATMAVNKYVETCQR